MPKYFPSIVHGQHSYQICICNEGEEKYPTFSVGFLYSTRKIEQGTLDWITSAQAICYTMNFFTKLQSYILDYTQCGETFASAVMNDLELNKLKQGFELCF